MRWLLLIFALLSCGGARAQRSLDIAFCDIEALYDTVPSKFYDDSDYTPQGRLRWDSQRYRRKVESVARLIDSLALPVVALWGVENEQVVRDVVMATEGDYAYVHRTHDGSDGLDFALLYYGDRFFPERITPWRGALCIEGKADGVDVAIIINHRCTSLGVLLSERGLLEFERRVVVLGTPGRVSPVEFGLKDHTSVAERAGRGNVVRSGGWQMRDRVSSTWRGEVRCDVYAAEWLLDGQGAPRPTYSNRKYYGGVSASLPIFAQFFYY